MKGLKAVGAVVGLIIAAGLAAVIIGILSRLVVIGYSLF